MGSIPLPLERLVYPSRHAELKQPTANAVRRSQGGACYTCGSTPGVLDVHHILPWALGGTNRRDNLMGLCRSCHRAVHRLMRSMGVDAPNVSLRTRMLVRRVLDAGVPPMEDAAASRLVGDLQTTRRVYALLERYGVRP